MAYSIPSWSWCTSVSKPVVGFQDFFIFSLLISRIGFAILVEKILPALKVGWVGDTIVNTMVIPLLAVGWVQVAEEPSNEGNIHIFTIKMYHVVICITIVESLGCIVVISIGVVGEGIRLGILFHFSWVLFL